MLLNSSRALRSMLLILSLVSLCACDASSNNDAANNLPGLKIKLLVGSALGDFCNQAAKNYNATRPKLDDGPKEQIALIDFNSVIKPPVIVDGTPKGKETGLQFISGLTAGGGTSLYDATLYARDWLQKNYRQNAINAVLVLTDGEDSGSKITLDQLAQELKKSDFNTDQRISFFTVPLGVALIL